MRRLRRRHQDGGVTIEIAIIAPVLILMLLLVVAFGRVASARGDVDNAARDAARAASLYREPSSATVAARKAATASLQTETAACRNHDVTVDTSHFEAGGYVAVDVICHADLSDLSLLQLPGTHDIRSRFVSSIDSYRTTAP